MNNYKILNIPCNSDKKIIKIAYRKLVKIHHPDRGGNKEAFIIIQKAYEDLLDGKSGEDIFSKKEVGSSIRVISTEMVDGSAKFNFRLFYVDYINFNKNKYPIKTNDYAGHILVTKKELEELNYEVIMTFKGKNGKYLEKSWSVKRPLTKWQKFKNIFKK
ncbi:MAG: DnaJ-class molecular chaperone [Flavobacteriaceae bacterium]|jgi:DnaJ-class molecular chaperone